MSSSELVDESTIVYNWNVTKDFPTIKSDEIDRAHIIDTIARVLTEDSPIVFLEGEAGNGSTTFLAQFCRENPSNSFALFIKPASRFSYSVDSLRFKIFEQIYWYLESVIFDKNVVDSSQYETYLQKLRRSKKSQTYFFVIDGLHQISIEDISAIEQIFKEVLPIGFGNDFRFIITGSQTFLKQFVGKFNSKTYQLPSFSVGETEAYFADTLLKKEEINEVRKLCHGIPGRLASVKRLLNSCMPLDQILNSDPSKYLEFIMLEFDVLSTLTDAQKLIIAVMVFGKNELTENEIIDVSGAHLVDLKAVKSICHFLQLSEDSKLLEFVSESHRRFAEKQLSHLSKQAIELHISYLIRHPESPSALLFLPSYYQFLNKQQAVLDLLSTEHYSKLLESTQSITALKNRAEVGFKSAIALKQITNVFKFSLHKSFFNAVTNRDGFESEISALVTLNKPNMALALANSTASKEDRLALLATYAKKTKQKNGALEPELGSLIRQLTDEIDFAECGDKVVDIATDILFFDPDLAVSIVEKAKVGSKQNQEKDQVLAHLSITASINNAPSTRNSVPVDDRARQKISDEATQKMTSTVAVLLAKYSVEELKSTIAKMESKHRVFFLQTYINLNKENPEILDVIEYALDFMISDTLYIPKSRDLADLVKPLPYCLNDIDRLRRLIIHFDSQLGLIQNLSMSKDLVIFHMCIARTQIHYDEQAALTRIEDVYYGISSIKDLETLMECYALLLDSLNQIDAKFKVEENHGYIGLVQGDLKNTIDEVLKQTASHYSVLKGVLDVLAATEPTIAMSIVTSINTMQRRDEAYRHITRILASKQFNATRAQILILAIQKIENPIKRSNAVLNVMNVVSLNSDKSNWIDSIIQLKVLVKTPKSQIKYLIKLLELNIDSGKATTLADFTTEFHSLIKEIDSKLDIVDLFFRAVSPLASIDEVASLSFYNEGSAIKKSCTLNSSATSQIFQAFLSLLFRASGPVMKTQANWESFIVRLGRLIDMLPSANIRASFFSELAVRAWCVDKVDICNFIIKKYCKPLLDTHSHNSELSRQLKLRMFTAFHCFHSDTAFQLLDGIYSEDRGNALYEAVTIRLRRLPQNEPYHHDEIDTFKINKEDAYDIVKILEYLEIDSDIYSVINSLVNSMTNKLNKTSFTAQQKQDIGNKLKEIIDSKLPDVKNIQHAGYKIAALAKVYELNAEGWPAWQGILNQAETIANIADRGFIYVQLSMAMPSKYTAKKKQLLEDALNLFYTIPSITDKLARLETFCKSANKVAQVIVKEALKKALFLTLELQDKSIAINHQKVIMDIAGKIDDKFSDELIELIDDDPARAFFKHGLKRSAAQIKSNKEFANAKKINDASSINKEFISESSWKNLAALLANKLETKSEEVMNEYVVAASLFPIEDSYPILSWYIENCSKRFTLKNDINEKVMPLVEVLFLTTEMAAIIIANSNVTSVQLDDAQPHSDGLILVPQSRDQALEYIKTWLRNNSTENIIYCDPYFGPDDIEFLRLVIAEQPESKVSVLTSKKHLVNVEAMSSQVFLDAWRAILDQEPPITEIIAIDSNEKQVIHDRWILTKETGIRLGTSFASLGGNKLSEISEMTSSEVLSCKHELNKFLQRERFVSGNRVNYTTFNL